MRIMSSVVLCGALAGAALIGVSPQAVAQEQRAQQAELRLGDPMPPLSELEWLKGEQVSSWEEGKVYVLDFWATWCGPCIRAMPHMIETQAKYADQGVQIIGVSVWENDTGQAVRKFTKDRTDLNYTIAYDRSGVAAKEFMAATGSRGIPTVMIVDQEGRYVWKGHPMGGMDEALAQIVAGEYNIDDAIEEQRRERELERKRELAMQKAQPLIERYTKAQQEENWNIVVKTLGEIADIEPEVFGDALINAYLIAAVELEDKKLMARIGRKVMSGAFAEQSALLNGFAWSIANPDDENPLKEAEMQNFEHAVKAAELAVELTEGEDASILDTLAWAQFGAGDVESAIDTQERAIKAASSDEEKNVYREGLETFKKGLGS